MEVGSPATVWDDLERALTRPDVPWREASKYLTKRKKPEKKMPGQQAGK